MIESSDLIALIRSFTSMFDQFHSCAVSRQWQLMVNCHTLLLRVLDFANPLTPFSRIINLAGSRIRRLKLYDFGSDIHEILLPLGFHNLEHLEISGHVSKAQIHILISILNKSQSPSLTIRFTSCDCFLDDLNTFMKNQQTSRIQLERGLSHTTWERCNNCFMIKSGLFRFRFPKCRRQYCSPCHKSRDLCSRHHS